MEFDKFLSEPQWMYYSPRKIRINEENGGSGKWMIYYNGSTLLHNKWEEFKQLYDDGVLGNVVSMKCSTDVRIKQYHNDQGVIVIYCQNSADEKNIMDIGNKIKRYLLHTGYDHPFLYYKTNAQTRLKIKGYTYKMCMTTDDFSKVCMV